MDYKQVFNSRTEQGVSIVENKLINIANDQFDTMLADITTKTSRINFLEDQREKASNRIGALESAVKEKDGAIDALECRVKRQLAEIVRAGGNLDSACAALSKMKARAETAESSFNARVASDYRLEQANAEIASLKNRLTFRGEQVKILQADKKAMESHMGQLRQSVKEVREEKNKLADHHQKQLVEWARRLQCYKNRLAQKTCPRRLGYVIESAEGFMPLQDQAKGGTVTISEAGYTQAFGRVLRPLRPEHGRCRCAEVKAVKNTKEEKAECWNFGQEIGKAMLEAWRDEKPAVKTVMIEGIPVHFPA